MMSRFTFLSKKTLLLFLFVILYCTPAKDSGMKHEKRSSEYTTCLLIQKNVINKAGKIQDYSDYYLRCSIQDYPIKLCESNVTGEQLKPYLNRGISVKMQIKEGMLDHCDENPAYVQSRTGTYVVILEIKE